jgi:LacI family transcriptional regulator
MATAACSVAHKKGLRIPQDIAIVGFDDSPISSAVWPTLTTVRQPYLEMARRSIQIFNAESETLQPTDRQVRHIIPHEIVERETTQPAGPGQPVLRGVSRG